MAEDSKRPEPIQTSRLSRADFAQIKARKLAADRQRSISLLLYHHGGVQVVPLVEGRKLVIGRFPPSDVVLRDGSLSRQHGSVELRDGEVLVEDLNSTNGTWVNGEQIKRCQVPAGAEIYFGAVSAAIHALEPGDARGYDLDSHDRFMADLASEILRAGSFKRYLALMLVRGEEGCPISHWFPGIRAVSSASLSLSGT